MSEILDRYNDIQEMIAFLQAEAAEIESALRVQVEETGTVAGHGWIAQLKPGRKSTDHEAAARKQINQTLFSELYDAHTTATAKTTLATVPLAELVELVGANNVGLSTAWAQITKASKCDLGPYTTQAPPVFVVERVK